MKPQKLQEIWLTYNQKKDNLINRVNYEKKLKMGGAIK
jgi:hypothetical protein